jgi:hypothetical protein
VGPPTWARISAVFDSLAIPFFWYSESYRTETEMSSGSFYVSGTFSERKRERRKGEILKFS